MVWNGRALGHTSLRPFGLRGHQFPVAGGLHLSGLAAFTCLDQRVFMLRPRGEALDVFIQRTDVLNGWTDRSEPGVKLCAKASSWLRSDRRLSGRWHGPRPAAVTMLFASRAFRVDRFRSTGILGPPCALHRRSYPQGARAAFMASRCRLGAASVLRDRGQWRDGRKPHICNGQNYVTHIAVDIRTGCSSPRVDPYHV